MLPPTLTANSRWPPCHSLPRAFRFSCHLAFLADHPQVPQNIDLVVLAVDAKGGLVGVVDCSNQNVLPAVHFGDDTTGKRDGINERVSVDIHTLAAAFPQVTKVRRWQVGCGVA